MSEAIEKIADWAQQIENHNSITWDRLPDIYLYMDQVLNYMDKQLCLFERNGSSKLLTSSMINNYVKDGVIDRPEQKKYSREHLAMLQVICMLKQVLSIQDISSMLKTMLEDHDECELYNSFGIAQSAALKEVCERVTATTKQGEAKLNQLAIELSIEANARRTAAERILSELAAQKERDKEQKK
jgi:DNA-binding transcriptional MerR regulator